MDELIPRLAKPGSTVADPLGHVLGIARKIDSRDGGTKRHSQVVARYAELTARELGLPEDVVDDIRLAGLLHDVGKSEIPERILAKPGPLSNIEWLEMRRHPWIAVELLEDSGLDQIREWIYCHHERPDGSGYPGALRGDDVPEGASLLALADAWDVMVSDRSYSAPMSIDAALAEARARAGTQFALCAVEALASLAQRGDLIPAAARLHLPTA